jgi:hypothetical protein
VIAGRAVVFEIDRAGEESSTAVELAGQLQLSKGGAMSSDVQLFDVAGRRRSPATLPDFHAGRAPANKDQRYAADPPTGRRADMPGRPAPPALSFIARHSRPASADA